MLTAKLISTLIIGLSSSGGTTVKVADAAPTTVTGWLYDNLCINNCKSTTSEGTSCTPDGSNAFYTPSKHTGQCLLLDFCIASGHSIMSAEPSGEDGRHSVVLKLTGDANHTAYELVRDSGTMTAFPMVVVTFDDTQVVSTDEDGVPSVSTVTSMTTVAAKEDPWAANPGKYYSGAPTTQAVCAKPSDGDIQNNMCFRSDVVVSDDEEDDMLVIESNGCPDHMNMMGGSNGTVKDENEFPCEDGFDFLPACQEKPSGKCCGKCDACGATGCAGGCNAVSGCSSKECSGSGCSGSGNTCNGCSSGGCSSGGCSSGGCSSGGCSGNGCSSTGGCSSGGCSGNIGCSSTSCSGSGCAGTSSSAGALECSSSCSGSTSSSTSAGCSGCGTSGGTVSLAGPSCSSSQAGCSGCGTSSVSLGVCSGSCSSCTNGCSSKCNALGVCSGSCSSCNGCSKCNACSSCGACGGKCCSTVGLYTPFYQHYTIKIPKNPGVPQERQFLKDDVVGIMFNGVILDSHKQTWSYDMCDGHSDEKRQYHYHIPQSCYLKSMGVDFADSSNWWINDDGDQVRNFSDMATQFPATGSPSPVVGVALDGFPIYALYDDKGALQRSKAFGGSLDECNGKMNSDGNYGYYLAADPPFAPACLKGSKIGTFEYLTYNKACPRGGIKNTIQFPTDGSAAPTNVPFLLTSTVAAVAAALFL